MFQTTEGSDCSDGVRRPSFSPPTPCRRTVFAPPAPDHLRDAQRIELAARRRGRRPASRSAPGRSVERRFGRVFLRRPHQQLDERFQLLAADAGRRRQLIERLLEQVAQRAAQKGRRQPAVAGQRPKRQWTIQTIRILVRLKRGPQRVVTAHELHVIGRRGTGHLLLGSVRVICPLRPRGHADSPENLAACVFAVGLQKFC